MATVADKIRADRKQLGLSHDRFGERLGTSRFTVIKWEKGQNLPRQLYRERLAALSGRTPDYYEQPASDEALLEEVAARNDAAARRLVA